MSDNTELRKALLDMAIQLGHVCRTAEREPAAYVASAIHDVEMRIADLADEVANETAAESQPSQLSLADWRNVVSEILERSAITLTVTVAPPAT